MHDIQWNGTYSMSEAHVENMSSDHDNLTDQISYISQRKVCREKKQREKILVRMERWHLVSCLHKNVQR